MSITYRMEVLPVTGELFIPSVQLPTGIRATTRGRPKHSVSLLQHMIVLLQDIQIARFHVKQRPIEEPTTVFAARKESLESFWSDDHDGKSTSQGRDRTHLLPIDPKTSTIDALLDADGVILPGLIVLKLSEDRQRLGFVSNDGSGSAGAKGASEAENVDRFKKARLAAAIRPYQQIDGRVWLHRHVRQ